MNSKANTDKFGYDKAHQEVFDKMEGIVEYAKRQQARAGVKRKSDALGSKGGPAERRRTGTRVISNGTRKKMVPGSFDDEDEDEPEAEENRRLSKRPRVTLDPVDQGDNDGGSHVREEEVDPEEELRRQKEREAIRRKLELNRARRRSSRGMPVPRTSLGRASQRASIFY
jgi:hypothetical protein